MKNEHFFLVFLQTLRGCLFATFFCHQSCHTAVAVSHLCLSPHNWHTAVATQVPPSSSITTQLPHSRRHAAVATIFYQHVVALSSRRCESPHCCKTAVAVSHLLPSPELPHSCRHTAVTTYLVAAVCRHSHIVDDRGASLGSRTPSEVGKRKYSHI